ncbi:hypothetical protein [Nocardioides sp.]|uniref:hypothetical protein n=1 Tax=Nocardioides sp. TaxID=35761 RepID=UPI00271BC6A5|nr:hypothetical protein [Nocardioides sp.]MDO9455347.1 hypothetical protein [Nocardioides sp.]
MLEARDFPVARLARSLEISADVLRAGLPEPLGRGATRALDAALAGLAAGSREIV